MSVLALAGPVSSIWNNVGLDNHPLSNVMPPRCAEQTRVGQGKPLLNYHIGFLACFHAISPECNQKSPFIFHTPIVLKPLVSLLGRLVACSARRAIDRYTYTHRPSAVTLAAHACRVIKLESLNFCSRQETSCGLFICDCCSQTQEVIALSFKIGNFYSRSVV